MDEKDASWQSNQFNASVSSTSGAQTSQAVTVMAPTMLTTQTVDGLQTTQEYQVVQGHQVSLQTQVRAQSAQSSSDAFHKLEEVTAIFSRDVLRILSHSGLLMASLSSIFVTGFAACYFSVDCCQNAEIDKSIQESS